MSAYDEIIYKIVQFQGLFMIQRSVRRLYCIQDENFIFKKYYLIIIQKDRLMEPQKGKFINRNLNLTYKQFESMGYDLTQYSLGDYVIQKIIGEGAFGRVYKGFNEKTAQIVAIKTIDIAMLHQMYRQPTLSKVLRLARTEDILLRTCKSDNIMKCFQVLENQSLKIIIMEYCSGGTLQKFIRQREKIPEKQALKIFKQILNGISEMHSHSIVHRDLKPENIMIHEGIYKIVDFGFSKQLIENNKINEGCTVVGTRPYMAPQVIKGQSYGLKVDIWSAAIILFQMIFGEYPFKQNQKQVLLTQIKNSELFKPKRIKANGIIASEQMSTFIKKMLVTDKIQRIGWKQLQSDPILNNKEHDNSLLPRSFVVDCPVNAPSQLEVSMISQLQQSYSTLLMRVEIKGRDSTDILIRKMSAQSILLKKKDLKIEKDNLYLDMNRNLIQCLKNELIYNEVILKMQQLSMLDMSKRISIELLYLLSQRCFMNMSSMNSEMLKSIKNHVFIAQIYQIVKTLYLKMAKTYNNYEKLLTQEQNKLLNRLKGFFFSPSKQQEKSNIFFNGIEKKDYKREEHLKFTQTEYINKVKNELRGSFKQVDKVRRYLMNYEVINQISFDSLKTTNFDAYVQRVIEK